MRNGRNTPGEQPGTGAAAGEEQAAGTGASEAGNGAEAVSATPAAGEEQVATASTVVVAAPAQKGKNLFEDQAFTVVLKSGSRVEFKGREYDLTNLTDTQYKRLTTDPAARKIVAPKER